MYTRERESKAKKTNRWGKGRAQPHDRERTAKKTNRLGGGRARPATERENREKGERRGEGSSGDEQRLQRGRAAQRSSSSQAAACKEGGGDVDQGATRRCRSSKELLVWTPAEQRGASSGKPAGWSIVAVDQQRGWWLAATRRLRMAVPTTKN
ncbi:hypothetical protein Syun_009189 [Stephania yunnanensis]|uniref:Uncharacterized protein n=1 Tax=Stephania yunnanensis TaxID=152371 RepID=A0AAP0PQN0_9MAGN